MNVTTSALIKLSQYVNGESTKHILNNALFNSDAIHSATNSDPNILH